MRHALGLQAVEARRQLRALLRRVEQSLAAIALAGLLHDPSLIDELFEDAGQALLGDLEDLEQVGHAQRRVAVDEMQHAVMRPTEREFGKHRVRLPRKIAVGEEQQLDEGEEMGIGARCGRSA